MTYLFFNSLHIQTLFTYLFRDYLSTHYFIFLFGSLIFSYHFQNACDRAHCINNAICQSGFTSKGYRCVCSFGFTGPHCEQGETYKCVHTLYQFLSTTKIISDPYFRTNLRNRCLGRTRP